jgi:membrane-associated HD superfamily phosphohydrolase
MWFEEDGKKQCIKEIFHNEKYIILRKNVLAQQLNKEEPTKIDKEEPIQLDKEEKIQINKEKTFDKSKINSFISLPHLRINLFNFLVMLFCLIFGYSVYINYSKKCKTKYLTSLVVISITSVSQNCETPFQVIL